MKNFIEKIKPVLKIAGALLAIFILWIVFNLFTGNKNHQPKFSQFGDEVEMYEESGFGVMEKSPRIFKNAELGFEDDLAFPQSPSLIEIENKIIKNGNLDLKVENTENSAQKISEITKNQGGKVFSTDFYERVKGQKSGFMTIKIPISKFEDTVKKIKSIATQVVSESTTEQDVTEQYTDFQAQLKNKRAEEESFVKILERTGNIEDVLATTKEISRVRGEIERLEGQIRFMNSQTDVSTITINLSEDIEIAPIQNDWRPWQVVKKSFSDLIVNIQDFVDGVIRFIIVGIPSMIPFLIFLWLVYFIGKKAWNKIRK